MSEELLSPVISPRSGRRQITSIGHYTLLKTVGQGQFGKVKLGVHMITKEKVAIKIIDKRKLDTTTLLMVSREVKIMKLLHHPHIIQLFEVIETEDHLLLVMEYAGGGEVMDYIVAHGRLQERDARRFFRQTVAALDYCHSLRVIHRDLKAENLLLDSNMNIKVIDFGLSNRFVPGAFLKTFCGSPTYTAPELIQRKKYEGPEVDVWSLGVVLFVLVCGYLPFDGNSFSELFSKIINGQYTVPDFVSPECCDLIDKMLVTDPQQRATIDMIREHPWVRVNDQAVPKAEVPILGALTLENINEDVLDEVVRAGFDREQCIQSLVNNTYDDASATYFLLLYKKKRTSHQLHQKQAEIDGVQPSAGSAVELVKQTQSGIALTSIHEGRESSPRELTPEELKRERRHSTKKNPKYPIDEKRARRHSAERPKRNITRVNQPTGHRRNNTVGSAVDIFEGPKSDRTVPSSGITSPNSRSPRSPVLSPKVTSPTGSAPNSPGHTHALIVLPSKRRPSEGEERIDSSSPPASESGSPAAMTRQKRSTSESYNPKDGRPNERTSIAAVAQQPVSPSKDRKLSATVKKGHRRYRSSDSKDQAGVVSVDTERVLKDKSPKKLKRLSDKINNSRGSMNSSPGSSPALNVQRHKMVKQTSTENVHVGGHANITIRHAHKSPRDSEKKEKDKNRHSREISAEVAASINNNNINNNNLTSSGSIDKSASVGHPLVHSQSTPLKLTVEESDDDWVIMNTQNSDDFKADHKESKKHRVSLLIGSFKTKFNQKLSGLLKKKDKEKEKEPRAVRFPVNEAATSAHPPDVMMENLKSALEEMAVTFTPTSTYCMTCRIAQVIFEAEVCRLPFLHLNAFRLRRISGDSWEYRTVCKNLLALLESRNSGAKESARRTSVS